MGLLLAQRHKHAYHLADSKTTDEGSDLKRILAAGLFIFGAVALLGGSHTAQAATDDPCAALTVESPQSDACDAAMDANPLPDLERPTEYNPKTDGRSR